MRTPGATAAPRPGVADAQHGSHPPPSQLIHAPQYGQALYLSPRRFVVKVANQVQVTGRAARLQIEQKLVTVTPVPTCTDDDQVHAQEYREAAEHGNLARPALR